MCNIAGLTASQAGRRTLVIDLDPQNNTRRDCGMAKDSGDRLLSALIAGNPLPVTPNVRPNLDVVQGGNALSDLSALMAARRERGAADLTDMLGASLRSIAHTYDLIIVDTPPNERSIGEAAMSNAAGLVITTRTDEASIDGLETMAERFNHARQRNPQLTLLGVILFGVRANASVIEREAREAITAIIGDAAPVFRNRIRDLQAGARDARRHGLLIHELEGHALQHDRFAELKGTQTPDTLDLRTGHAGARGLADDYWGATEEILIALNQSIRESA